MAQTTNGIWAALSHPLVYDGLQAIMRAKRIRTEFVQHNVRPQQGDRILDIGCGTAELLAFLPDNISYIGYDPSGDYIASAKQRYGGKGQFFAGYFDAKTLAKHEPFDIVIASGVLHHMDDEQVTAMLQLAKKALKNNGRLVTIDPVFCDNQNPIARFLINMDRGQNVRTANQYNNLAQLSFSSVAGKICHRSGIPYTHWVMECQV